MSNSADGRLHELISGLRTFCEQQADVRLAYLHGSVMRDMVWKGSDLDIAVLLDESLDARAQFRRTLELMQEIDLLRFAPQDADVRLLNRAPLEFQFEVCAQGRCVFARDTDERDSFETSVMREFYDFKPALDVYYEGVVTRARTGEPSAEARRHREKIRALVERNRETREPAGAVSE